MKPVVIGLLGDIGSGKTTAGKIFKQLGAKLIDADLIAKDVLDMPEIRKALIRLWPQLKTPGHAIDRKKLSSIAFSSKKNIQQLNKLTHPEILRRIKQQLNNTNSKVVVIDAPLLMETNTHNLCDALVYISCPLSNCVKRVQNDRNWTLKEFHQRKRWQISSAEKQKIANFIIDNSKDIKDLHRAISILYRYFCTGGIRYAKKKKNK